MIKKGRTYLVRNKNTAFGISINSTLVEMSVSDETSKAVKVVFQININPLEMWYSKEEFDKWYEVVD